MNITKGIQTRPQRLVVYGQEGIGKSTLASRLPAPLVLDTEGGTGQLNVDRIDVATLKQLEDSIREIIQEKQAGRLQYRTVVIDTVDRLWKMCADDLVAKNKWESIESPGYGRGLKMASERFTTIITMLDWLISAGLYVVCVCHSKVEQVSLPDKEAFTMYQLKVSAPGKQAEESAAFLKQWADCVLFCMFDTVVNMQSGKAVAQKRVIRTEHNACWEAKNRFGLPERIEMTHEGIEQMVGLIYGKPEPAATAPAQAAQTPAAMPAEQPAAPAGDDAELAEWAKEDSLLVEFFVAQGKLKQGQDLTDLPGNIKTALRTRRDAALAKARAWKGGQA